MALFGDVSSHLHLLGSEYQLLGNHSLTWQVFITNTRLLCILNTNIGAEHTHKVWSIGHTSHTFSAFIDSCIKEDSNRPTTLDDDSRHDPKLMQRANGHASHVLFSYIRNHFVPSSGLQPYMVICMCCACNLNYFDPIFKLANNRRFMDVYAFVPCRYLVPSIKPCRTTLITHVSNR